MRRDEVVKTVTAHRDELREMGVSSLALFGSTARDEAREDSDVDLLIEFDPERHVGLFGFVAVQERLEEILGVPKVDLVMPGRIYEELKDDILGEAIPIA